MKKEEIGFLKAKNHLLVEYSSMFAEEIKEKEKNVLGITVNEGNLRFLSDQMWAIETMRNIAITVLEHIKDAKEGDKLIESLKYYLEFSKRANIKPKIIEFMFDQLYDFDSFSNTLLESLNERYVYLFEEDFIAKSFLPMSEEDISLIKTKFSEEGFAYFPSDDQKYVAIFEKETEGRYYFESWFEAYKWILD